MPPAKARIQGLDGGGLQHLHACQNIRGADLRKPTSIGAFLQYRNADASRAPVSVVARRNHVNATLVFKWRRRFAEIGENVAKTLEVGKLKLALDDRGQEGKPM